MRWEVIILRYSRCLLNITKRTACDLALGSINSHHYQLFHPVVQGNTLKLYWPAAVFNVPYRALSVLSVALCTTGAVATGRGFSSPYRLQTLGMWEVLGFPRVFPRFQGLHLSQLSLTRMVPPLSRPLALKSETNPLVCFSDQLGCGYD